MDCYNVELKNNQVIFVVISNVFGSVDKKILIQNLLIKLILIIPKIIITKTSTIANTLALKFSANFSLKHHYNEDECF